MLEVTISMEALIVICFILWLTTLHFFEEAFLQKSLLGRINPIIAVSLVVVSIMSIICSVGIITKSIGLDLL